MHNERTYVCYNSFRRKLGIIKLKSNSDDLKEIFIDNKILIKDKYPGTAFIKLHKANSV